MSNYRNRKLTQSAKHESCVSCGADDGTIVWAHSNRHYHGKGTGIKAHDLFGAYLCHKCHTEFDSNEMPAHTFFCDSLEDWFRYMNERSLIIACRKGYL